MRSIWKGVVSFGLVTIPVKLYTATEDKNVRFHLLHKDDNSRIEYKRFCADEQIEVDSEDIIRGYEYSKGQYVTVDEHDFEAVPLTTSHAVEIMEFVSLPEVDPIYFQKSYYLEPQEGASRPYALLREAMVRANKAALAKVVLREKEHLVTVRVMRNALVLDTLFYPDEVRDTDQLEGLTNSKVNEQEVKMAVSLVKALSTKFEPTKYKDEYREALLEVITHKIEGTPVEATPIIKPSSKAADLMETLRASVKAAKEPIAKQRKAIA